VLVSLGRFQVDHILAADVFDYDLDFAGATFGLRYQTVERLQALSHLKTSRLLAAKPL